MKSSLLVLASSIAGVYASFPVGETYHKFAPRQTGISWQPCFTSGQECGTFDVPLDYNNPAAGKATLAVIRYKATAKPRMGTILTNPGGPGQSGVNFLSGAGVASISKMAGGHYDLVSWDPRGVGATKPRIDCFPTNPEENAFWVGTVPGGLEARGNFTDKVDLDYFYSQVDRVDTKLQEMNAKCLQLNGDNLKYVGSVAAVKDMISLSDYLEGPGKPVNYWGFSYGTVIGSYFVNMYPERVGRVILDGVVNPDVWGAKPPHLTWGDWLQSADEALEGFALACATAGPAGCALALTPTTTPVDILKWILALIDKAYDYHRAGGVDYTSSALRSHIHQGMYQPTGWVTLAQDLLSVDKEITQALKSSPPSKAAGVAVHKLLKRQEENQDNSYQAIMCADAIDPTGITTKQVFDELVRVSREVSPTFGPQWGIFRLSCHRWTTRAVERYAGPWNKKLANPILVIGNEADPITPYASAKFVADQLGDSATLVEQDDYGHCSMSMHSDCTAGIIGSYFVQGKLPSTDQFCGTNAVLFPGPGVTKASLKGANGSGDPSSGGFTTPTAEKISQLQKERKTLFYIALSLMVAVVLLFIGLLAQFFNYRRKSARGEYAKVAGGAAAAKSKGGKVLLAAPRDSYDAESSYADPWVPPKKH